MSERLDPNATDEDLLASVKTLGPLRELTPVPEGLWGSIATEVAKAEAERSRPDDATPERSNVVPMRSRWRRPAIAASAAVVITLAAVGSVVLRGGSDEPAAERLAQARLEPLADEVVAGSSVLEQVGDTYFLEVDADVVATGTDFLELWLLDAEATEPISLGRYEGSGVYAVPAGISPTEYPVVDISIEPDDGDESHSGASVLRGALDI